MAIAFQNLADNLVQAVKERNDNMPPTSKVVVSK